MEKKVSVQLPLPSIAALEEAKAARKHAAAPTTAQAIAEEILPSLEVIKRDTVPERLPEQIPEQTFGRAQKMIGDYLVVKHLGQGSLGSTFLCQHRFLKRFFTLKMLPEDLCAESGFLERFEKEVAGLATLEHPHILKLESVSHIDGRYFLISQSPEEAVSLADFLAARKEKISEEDIAKLVFQIASALDYAHGQKIEGKAVLHLSLKLNNVLISKSGGNLTAHLADFGLSRLLGPGFVVSRIYKTLSTLFAKEQKEESPSKLHAAFIQAYTFLAPEQKICSAHQKFGPEVDIYAFGILVYFLLMKKFPEGFFELPSHRSTDYKLSWDLLLFKCLHTEPSKRPSLLKEVVEDLVSMSSSKALPTSIQKWASGVSKLEQENLETVKPVLKPGEIERPQYDADPGAIFKIETSVGKYQPKQNEERATTPLLAEMVVVSQGTYMRGSNKGARDEMPRHAVNLNSFAVDVHPVTNEQFVRFLEALGGEKDVNNSDIIRLRESRIKRSSGKLSIESGYAKHPVVGVTWYGAVAYAKWVGKRLLTEAEWEAAASGGVEDWIYPNGNNIEKPEANFFSSDTTAVMSYKPNEFGIYDMAGNVYEWCQDWYDYHYYGLSVQEPVNPKGPNQGVYRVLRGGCWKSLKEDLRIAHRHRNNPGVMNGTTGFRCAADVE